MCDRLPINTSVELYLPTTVRKPTNKIHPQLDSSSFHQLHSSGWTLETCSTRPVEHVVECIRISFSLRRKFLSSNLEANRKGFLDLSWPMNKGKVNLFTV